MSGISVLVDSLDFGGTAVATKKHFDILSEIFEDCNLIVIKPCRGINNSKILSLGFSFRKPIFFMKNFFLYRKNVHEAVICMHFNAFVFALFNFIFGCNSKIFVYFHTDINAYEIRQGLIRRIAFRCLVYLTKYCEGIIFLTDIQGFVFREKIKNEIPVYSLPNPYKPSELKPNVRKNKIVFVGRLSEEKNVPFIISAYKEYVDMGGKYSLEIFGDGPLKKELYELVKKLNLQNIVTFHGYVSDVYKEISTCKTLILASSIEGFPISLLEAIDAKLNIVSSLCSDAVAQIFNISSDVLSEKILKMENVILIQKPDFTRECLLDYANALYFFDHKSGFTDESVRELLTPYSRNVVMVQWKNILRKFLF